MTDINAGYGHVSTTEVESKLERGERPTLVDVRNDWEYVQYHLPGAILMPLPDLASLSRDLSADDEIIVICEHGVRSDVAARFLAARGCKNVSTMEGGMAAYEGSVLSGR